ERVYAEARSPRELIRLHDATHTGFSGLVSFPSSSSYDVSLGCPLVVKEFGGENSSRLQTLNDPANGIDVANCAPPCSSPVPTNAPMPAARQPDLTQASVVAFFESRFRHSRPAACLLRRALPAENPDVSIAIHRAGR